MSNVALCAYVCLRRLASASPAGLSARDRRGQLTSPPEWIHWCGLSEDCLYTVRECCNLWYYVVAVRIHQCVVRLHDKKTFNISSYLRNTSLLVCYTLCLR